MLRSTQVTLRILLTAAIFGTVVGITLVGCGESEQTVGQGASQSADPATDEVHECDTLAAHPEDPYRMAEGLTMEQLVPRPALQDCGRAVKEHPSVPRFHYQLGRAQEASGQAEAAFASYNKAAELGHRMADYNLALSYARGTGTAVDHDQAKAHLQKAADAGVAAAKNSLGEYVFSVEGYSNPDFFRAVYGGETNKIGADPTDLATYLATFIEPFTQTEGCGRVISNQAMTKLAQHTQMNVLGQMFGTLAGAKNDHASGDFAGAGAAGYRAGERLQMNLAGMVDKGHEDAQLFYDRHGCVSRVAKRFFANLDVYARQLASASFQRELEKNIRRR